MPDGDTLAVLESRFRDSRAVVVTEYRGLSAAELGELRGALRGTARYQVAKNTYARLAAGRTPAAGLAPLLSGPNALVFVSGEAPVAFAALRGFAKTHPALVVKGAVFEGRVLSAAQVARLADLPSREQLLGRFAAAAAFPLRRAAAAWRAPATRLGRAMSSVRGAGEDL